MSKKPKNYWNYRVIEYVDPNGEVWRAIHEVHYENDKPVSYTEEPAGVGASGEDMEKQMLQSLAQMREALVKPILVEKDFKESTP